MTTLDQSMEYTDLNDLTNNMWGYVGFWGLAHAVGHNIHFITGYSSCYLLLSVAYIYTSPCCTIKEYDK